MDQQKNENFDFFSKTFSDYLQKLTLSFNEFIIKILLNRTYRSDLIQYRQKMFSKNRHHKTLI